MVPFRPALGAIVAVALTLPAPGSRAQDMEQAFRQGLSAYQRADGLQAGEFWEPCAHAGHADCQYALGVLFDDGAADWPANTATALVWLTRAARQGHLNAQLRLGFLYAVGRDALTQDIEEAYVWFSMAAAGGSRAARGHRAKVMELMTEAELERANRQFLERGIRYQLSPIEESDAVQSEAPPSATSRTGGQK